MANNYASGKIALGICDRCGLTYDLHDLKGEFVKGVPNNLKVCRSCFDTDHPQLFLGETDINDPQALRDPRVDTGETESRELTIPGGYGTVEEYLESVL